MTKHELAEWLHDNYEQLAKAENWQTQEITRVKFEGLPAENKSTMLALADRMLNAFKIIIVQADVIKSVCKHNGQVEGNVIRCTKCKTALCFYEQSVL